MGIQKKLINQSDARAIHLDFVLKQPKKALKSLNEIFGTNVSSNITDIMGYSKEIKTLNSIDFAKKFNSIAFSDEPKKLKKENDKLPKDFPRCVKINYTSGNSEMGWVNDRQTNTVCKFSKTYDMGDHKYIHVKNIQSIVSSKPHHKTFEQCCNTLWNTLHETAENITTKEILTDDEYKIMAVLVKTIGKSVPCDDCRIHFKKLQEKHSFPDTRAKRTIAEHICKLHNNVNARLGKPTYDAVNLKKDYKKGGKS